MNKINKDNLNYLGKESEYRIVKSILENREYYYEIIPILKEDVFTDNAIKIIVKAIINWNKEKGTIPTYKELGYAIKDKITDADEFAEVRDAFVKLKDDQLLVGLDTAAQIGLNLLKRLDAQRILKNAMTSLKDNYSADKLNRIVEQLQALEVRVNNADIVNPIDMLDSVITQTYEERIPTGIFELDECMRDGLKKGTVGLLIAGTGVGKTTLSSIMCCNAALNGYKVLHIFFEDDTREVLRKYYAKLSGKNSNEFYNKNDENEINTLKEEMFQKYMNNGVNVEQLLKNNVRLTRMENGETTVTDIKNLVRKLINIEGWKPDMIFIDYISCLRTTSNEVLRMQNEYQTFERMMKEIESFANTQNIAIWVAQQTNRRGLEKDTANNRMANVQGSFRITQPASAVLYIDKTNCQNNSTNNYANIYLDKIRGGETKAWKNAYMNNGTCQINLSEAEPIDKELEFEDNKEEDNNEYELKYN